METESGRSASAPRRRRRGRGWGSALSALALCAVAADARTAEGGADAAAPFHAAEGLFDAEAPRLGLQRMGSEPLTIWRGAEETHRFSHHPNLVAWDDTLFLMWSNGLVHEDSPGQRILYSRSRDGLDWSPPRTIVEDRDGAGICVATGWVVHGDELIALFTVTGGENFHPDTALYAVRSEDGERWSERTRLTSGFFIESPRVLSDGALLIGGEAVGEARQTRRMRLLRTERADGLGGWEESRIDPGDLEAFRYTEPGFFSRPDGTLVAAFRTQTGHLYASVSVDLGRSWSTPVPTDFPDATARFWAGNLPDGTAVLVGNPLPRGDRSLLTLALSPDGVRFDRAWLLRGEPTAMVHEGRHKLDGWQYPNGLVWGDHLLIAHSVNKEDVALTRIPLESLR